MRLLGTFIGLLMVASFALAIAWEEVPAAQDTQPAGSAALIGAGGIAAISFVLLCRIVYRVSRRQEVS